jgi:hypothetical protein
LIYDKIKGGYAVFFSRELMEEDKEKREEKKGLLL